MEKYEKVEKVLEHIKHVQDNCYKLGFKLIKTGQFELGRNLIANGLPMMRHLNINPKWTMQ